VRLEQSTLLRERVGAVVPVEPGLADRDGRRMGEKLAELADPLGFGRRGLMRIDADRRRHALVRVGDRERGMTRLDSGPDRDDPCHARRARAQEQLLRVLVARVEVRVGVDHAAGAGSSMRGKSGSAGPRPSTG